MGEMGNVRLFRPTDAPSVIRLRSEFVGEFILVAGEVLSFLSC